MIITNNNKILSVFDFDGVLVDTTEIQVLSIAVAIKRIAGFPIKHPSDWEIIYSTITTKDKLIKFAKKKYLPMGQIEEIYSEKKKIAKKSKISKKNKSHKSLIRNKAKLLIIVVPELWEDL